MKALLAPVAKLDCFKDDYFYFCTPHISAVFLNKFVNEIFRNLCFFEDCDLEDTSLANKQKN